MLDKVNELKALLLDKSGKLFQRRSSLERFFLDYSLKTHRTDDGIDPHVVAYSDPNSLIAEQYKALCTKLFVGNTETAMKTVAVTSSQPGEGKTTTVSNLAAALASNFKQKVIIIDADLRRPAIHKFFGIPKSPGLVDILKGSADYRQFTEEPAVRNLFVIPAGSPTENPGGLLNSIGIKVLLSRIASKFDIVIFDTSPVLKTADAQAVGAFCDAVLFVVKANVTPRHMIEDAFATLKDTSGMPHACLLTNTRRVLDYYSYWTNPDYRHYYNESQRQPSA